MPEYLFEDKNGHALKEAMTFEEYTDRSGGPLCPKCGEVMQRQYRAPGVVWGGLRPSQGEHSPAMQKFFNSADARRAEFEKEHEHEQET